MIHFAPEQVKLLPRHYDKLAAFRSYFTTGTPILTFHAIDRPPSGTAYRGLFYPPDRFDYLLAELQAANFTSVAPSGSCYAADNPERRISLTFDDGYRNLHQHALGPLARHKFHATVYLVADLLGGSNTWDASLGVTSCPLMDKTEIKDWLAAGHRIGSHTLTHPHLTQLSPEQAQEEIAASKKKLEDLFGVPVEDFCYPYGDSGDRERELVAKAGYRTACSVRYGVNILQSNPYDLRRITVRTPNRSWKTLRNWIKRNYLIQTGSFPH